MCFGALSDVFKSRFGCKIKCEFRRLFVFVLLGGARGKSGGLVRVNLLFCGLRGRRGVWKKSKTTVVY